MRDTDKPDPPKPDPQAVTALIDHLERRFENIEINTLTVKQLSLVLKLVDLNKRRNFGTSGQLCMYDLECLEYLAKQLNLPQLQALKAA